MTNLSDFVTSAFWRVNAPDADPAETREWLDAFDALVRAEGRERATFLLRKLLDHARRTRTRSRSPTSRNFPATSSSKAASRRSCAGTPWRW
jgi:pyruvate dehydrogenase complex dehydrogenase (E1) component